MQERRGKEKPLKKLIVTFVLGVCALSMSRAQSSSGPPRPGDIFYLDWGDAINGAYVVKFVPGAGPPGIISSHLNSPEAIAVDRNGQIIVASYSSIIRIEPMSGTREVIADLGKFGGVWGIALAPDGDIFATFIGGRYAGHRRYYFPDCEKEPKFKLSSGIVQIAPATGKIKAMSSRHSFQYPIGVALAESGDLFVVNVAFPSEIVRISSKRGTEKVVSKGDHLHFPLGITVSGQYAYVTDVATEDQNFGIGAVVRVDIDTGAQTVLTSGNNLLKPVGIAMDLNGQLIVTDPYTINPSSRDLYDGGIIRIDPVTGLQTLLARGHDNIINPTAVTVVRDIKGSQ